MAILHVWRRYRTHLIGTGKKTSSKSLRNRNRAIASSGSDAISSRRPTQSCLVCASLPVYFTAVERRAVCNVIVSVVIINTVCRFQTVVFA